jgi:2-iminobutanoate/2-iminopropanoate deaminase
MRQYINNSYDIPKVKSPISQAVVVGNHCYLSGQLSTDQNGNYIAGTVLEEAEKAFENIFSVANAAGFDKSDLVFIDIAFIDLQDIGVVNELYARLFEEDKRPARTIYQAAALPFGGKVKVTAIGLKS